MLNRRSFFGWVAGLLGGINMTVKSWPWSGTTQGDAAYAPYTNKWFADFFQLFLVYDRRYEVVVDTGHLSYPGGLQVSDTGGDVTVQSGVGIVDGMMFTNDAPLVLTPANTPSIRTDLVIARKNITGPGTPQTIDLVIKGGTNGNNTPPALTQSTATWEVALAEIDITPGPVIAAVRFVGRAVRTPLGPGYQFASLPTVDAGPRTGGMWESLNPPLVMNLGPGPWAVNGTLNFKAQGGNGTRFARIYNNTLAQPVTWGNGYGVAAEGACIQMAERPISIGVICELEIQFYGGTVDDIYADDNSEGPSTSMIAKRVV